MEGGGGGEERGEGSSPVLGASVLAPTAAAGVGVAAVVVLEGTEDSAVPVG